MVLVLDPTSNAVNIDVILKRHSRNRFLKNLLVNYLYGIAILMARERFWYGNPAHSSRRLIASFIAINNSTSWTFDVEILKEENNNLRSH